MQAVKFLIGLKKSTYSNDSTFTYLSDNYCYCPEVHECIKPSEVEDEWLFEDCNQFCRSGLLRLGGATYGVPVMMSWPHFWNADSILLDQIEGLQPMKEQHDTYIDIDPITGYPLSTHIRIQVTIYITLLFYQIEP